MLSKGRGLKRNGKIHKGSSHLQFIFRIKHFKTHLFFLEPFGWDVPFVHGLRGKSSATFEKDRKVYRGRAQHPH